MSDIFICYSRADSSIATRLMQRLQAEGWSVFIDQRTPVGRRWHQEIERELRAAKAVVVLWSASSRDSDFVLEEAEYGKRKSILFPAFIEQVEFPYGFSRIQTADLVGWSGDPEHAGLIEFLNAMRLHLNGQTKASTAQAHAESVQPATSTSFPDVSGKVRQDVQRENSDGSPIRKFLLPAILIILGIVIYPAAETLYEQWTLPKIIPSEVSQRESLPIKAQKKENQTQPSALPKSEWRPPELVLIPAGSFEMGEQDQKFIKTLDDGNKRYFGVPSKRIEISKPFYLGKTEVTYEQYDYYIQAQQHNDIQVVKPATAEGGRDNQPVVNVSWHEATAYAAWLGKQIERECRLPTEAEWEYAARAGTKTAYPWDDDLGSNNANCDGCRSPWDGKQSAPVGSFATNKFGLYDMSGNVWEWTCSAWRDQFDGQEQQCGEKDNVARVLRGGDWGYNPLGARSASRYINRPDYRGGYLGFRVLCSSPIDE